MADTSRTVGSGGQDIDLSAWETVVEGIAGEHTATLVADIVDNLKFGSWQIGSTAIIKGNLTGNTKRRITSVGGAGTVVTCNSSNMTALTLEDLYLDGTGMVISKFCLDLQAGIVTCTMRRCTLYTPSSFGSCMKTHTISDYTTGTYDNCIFDTAYSHLNFDEIHQENTSTFRNCLFTGATNNQASWVDNALVIINYYNCVSFSNAGEDYTNDALTLTNIHMGNCVSEEGSAQDSHDNVTSSGGAISQTNLSAYFTDYVNGDYTLAQSSVDSWGIDGDSAATPARDYNNIQRINNSIGPYEFIVATHMFVNTGGGVSNRIRVKNDGQFAGASKRIAAISTYEDKLVDRKTY